jgi:hypothetical protein
MGESIECLRQGVATVGDVSYAWAVFDTKAAEAEVGWVADTGNTEFAERLTGWRYSYRGPGRAFSDEPCVRVYGRKLIVTQRRGVDV